ncbi:ATP-binding cassette domain-containing protein [Bifidobacterium thermacidophilum]|uniref:ATP-binding cassette domain-containing protein n=1 Tax=Bifidobacterium thermacidophilum TaxID=246618 RepID=UPI000400EBD9|nr:ATP-binding cassette domain-containing protein [Bifidobacterium thermacidophilum]
MENTVFPGIRASDIVVRLDGVCKQYKQRQGHDGTPRSWRNLFRRQYKTITALDNLDLTIHRGETVAYAGPNGAGKSTTIKRIAGLLTPDSGTVTSLGMNPFSDRVRYVRNIAVVFGQRTELWWDHPVSSSFRWKKSIWKIDDETYSRQIGILRERFNLAPIWNSLARDLSLGQRMRADLALALLPDPQLLLLDEPTLGLDVEARMAMLRYIGDLNANTGLTILITSHNTSDLEELGQRVVLVAQGTKRFDGSFSQLRAQVGDVRDMCVVTDSSRPPQVPDTIAYDRSEGRAHYYHFMADEHNIMDIIDMIGRQCRILDISIERTSIDNILTQLYRRYNSA